MRPRAIEMAARVTLRQASRDVYWVEPLKKEEDSALVGNTRAPSVILIFGWMGAQIPHITKYMESYATLYPNARQILVQHPRDLIFRGNSSRKASVAPAIQLLNREGMFGPEAPGLLVHVFSNGGGFQLAALSRMMQDDLDVQHSRPSVAVILDSMPGRMTLRVTFKALFVSVKSKLLRWLLFLPFSLIYSAFKLLSYLTRAEPMIDQLRRLLNQEQFLPWTTKATPRLYLFSDTDELVAHNHVLEHVTEARDLGLNVKTVEFRGTPHVAHARQDPERYWRAVEDAWSEATKSA